jgi:hypothetical protein
LKCYDNVCLPDGLPPGGDCSGGLACEPGSLCNSSTNTCDRYPQFGEDCINGLCYGANTDTRFFYFCDKATGKCINRLGFNDSCDPSTTLSERFEKMTCGATLQCLEQPSGGGLCKPVVEVGKICGTNAACLQGSTCIDGLCVEDAPGNLLAGCGQGTGLTCPSDKQCSTFVDGVQRCLYTGGVRWSCNTRNPISCNRSSGLECREGYCRIPGLAPLGSECVKDSDCAPNINGRVSCENVCVVTKALGEACDERQFMKCADNFPIECYMGTCALGPRSVMGKPCSSSSECGFGLTCDQSKCTSFTARAGEVCIQSFPSPISTCLPNENLECKSRRAGPFTFSYCYKVVGEGERCNIGEYIVCKGTDFYVREIGGLTCVLGSCVPVKNLSLVVDSK